MNDDNPGRLLILRIVPFAFLISIGIFVGVCEYLLASWDQDVLLTPITVLPNKDYLSKAAALDEEVRMEIRARQASGSRTGGSPRGYGLDTSRRASEAAISAA